MNVGLLEISNSVMDTYKEVKDSLRFDGEYINHFTSLIYGGEMKEINLDNIKKVRKYIKTMTGNLSSFRGDSLYIISILVSKEENYKEFSENLIKISEYLEDVGFKDSPGLVFSSYAIAKHGDKECLVKIFNNMKLIYDLLRKEFRDITDENDYLMCALLGIKCAKENEDAKETGEFVESMFNYLLSLKQYSKNHLQMLATGALLNKNYSNHYEIKKFIKTFKENNMKVGDEYLSLVSTASRNGDVDHYMSMVNDVMEYLCDEEGEYLFYMDKTFRVMIGITIVEFYNRRQGKNCNIYLEELVAFSVYSFLVSRKQGLFEEAYI